jgi:2-oxo-4-hydroxy-4-carboxy-5-ureidoimidazoline decarboxylase
MEPWQRVDSAPPAEARRLLSSCCGSTRWVDGMMARRPFGGLDPMLSAAADVWRGLSVEDWKEAFAHHPRIGEQNLHQGRYARTAHLSTREQAGAAGASDDVRRQLAGANRRYEARFGYLFIVCATGLGAGEMLARLRSRLGNDPAAEIQVAAEEQARITALRLRAIA